MHKLVSVSKLKANPFRKLETYPIKREKVDALKESYQNTTYWGNILARPGANGTYEIAYGHHRLVALQESKTKEAEVIVRKLSDEQMIRIMARENMEEWASNAALESETLRTVLEAYAAGKIDLGKLDPKTKKSLIVYAPSTLDDDAISDKSRQHPYTKFQLAKWLGWIKGEANPEPNFAFTTAFRALQLIERGIIKESHLAGKKRDEASTILAEASRAYDTAMKHARQLERAAKASTTDAERKKREDAAKACEKKAEKDARKVADFLGAGFSTGHVARNEAKEKARKLIRDATPAGERDVPRIGQIVDVLSAACRRFLFDDANAEKLEAALEFPDEWTPKQKAELLKSFKLLAGRVEKYITILERMLEHAI